MKKFSRYTKKRFKAVSHDLSSFAKTSKLELLHEIRIEVKKIKALLNVIEFCVKGFRAHKHYILFRTIFRKAGKIREADVLVELMQTHGIKAQQISNTESILGNKERIVTFQNEIPHFLSSIEKESKRIMDSVGDVNRLDFEKYLDRKKDQLRAKVFPRQNQKELHKTRKTIKEILYLSTITKKTKKDPHPFYDELQLLIGQWHDKQIVISMLDKNKNPTELKQIKAECQDDIRRIKYLIREFYGS